MSDLGRYQDPLTIQRVLHNAKTIAIVGLSKNDLRATFHRWYPGLKAAPEPAEEEAA